MKNMFTSRATLVITLLLATTAMQATGVRSHYRATPYDHEPRPERDRLTTLEVGAMGGSATKRYDKNGNLSDIIERTNIANMALSTTGLDLTKTFDADLHALSHELMPDSKDFGVLEHRVDKFKYWALDFNLTQNLWYGFFAKLNIPVERVESLGITIKDLTPVDGHPSNQVSEWQRVLADLNGVMQSRGVDYDLDSQHELRVPDVNLELGWTYNNDNLDSLDFLDLTLTAGVSVPTESNDLSKKPFLVKSGSDGHVSVPLGFDIAIGALDWMTVGANVHGRFFAPKTKDHFMKTDAQQDGVLMLNHGMAKRDRKAEVEAGAFVKADHIFKGLSMTLGYNWTHRGSDELTPENSVSFDKNVVNNDARLSEWNMHALTAGAEYDFGKDGNKCNPKVGLFYSRPVGGKNVLATDTYGSNVGVNMVWDY